MRKVLLFLTVTIAATLLLMRFSFRADNKEEVENESDKSTIAAQDYWNSMRADVKTGKFNPNDAVKAMVAMTQFDNANRGSRSGVPAFNWNFKGPDNVGGRTRALLFQRKTGYIFAGGVSGGLWISKDGGGSFSPWSGNYSDTVQAITVASICEAANGDIYFGTGEGQYFNNGDGSGGFPGSGIWKSTDGGSTFHLLPSTKPTLNNLASNFTHVNRMVASPKRAGVIYAATNRGVYKTLDSGKTWNYVRKNAGLNSISDIEITADDQYVLVCSSNSTGNGNFFRGRSSNSATDTLYNVTAISASGRLECAVSHDSANYAYLAQVNNSDGSLAYVWQSKDWGSTWKVIGKGTGYDPNPKTNGLSFDPLGNQGDYDLTMEVVPGYKDVIYLGGQIEMWRWSAVNNWEKVTGNSISYYVHPDMHFIAFNPLSTNVMIVGCDGGLFKSTNATVNPSLGTPTFQQIDHSYCVTQQYSCASDAAGTMTMGGAQDNGTHLVNGKGYTKYSGVAVSGGDGGKCEISQYDPTVMFASFVSSEIIPNYGTVQSGAFITRSISGGSSFATVWDKRTDKSGGSDGKKNGGLDDGGAFVTPFLLWEKNYPSPWTYTDTSFLAVGSDLGTVWICPWATDRSNPLKWFKLQSNGNGQATSIAASSDGNYLFVGYSNGEVVRYGGMYNLFKTGRWHYYNDTAHANTWNPTDSGISMTDLGNLGRYVTNISVDFNNPKHVVFSLGNYGQSNYIYKSNNATSGSPTFSSIQGSGTTAIPAMPIYSCCIDAADSSVILAGTDLGVYVSADGGSTWVHKSQGMGNLPITAIRQYFQNGAWQTYVATHGHGIYSIGLWTGINDVYKQVSNIASGKVYPNPATTKTTLQFHIIRDAEYGLKVYDLSGKLVYSQSPLHYVAGDNHTTIPVANLPTGTYIAMLSSATDDKTYKITVIH